MQIGKAIRMNLIAALTSVLIVFTVALAIPMAYAFLAIYRSFATPDFLVEPTAGMDLLFILCIEAIFLSFAVWAGCSVIATDRKTRD
jgi:hypothetical protein